ncbi:MAG: tetratricopeptide repeat protein, partial [Terracidiphilus sp.]
MWRGFGFIVMFFGLLAAAQSGLAQSGAVSSSSSAAAPSGSARQPAAKKRTAKRQAAHRASRASRVARTHRIKKAFVASKELEPMAQQLATLRTPEAYAAVAAYARGHDGDAAAAAYLALGHAYLLDKRYADAQTALAEARRFDGELADYAEFLDALASHESGNDAVAENILHGFTERFPDSILDVQVPELEAGVQLALGNHTAAREALAAAAGTESASRPGFELAEGQVELALGDQAAAIETFRRLFAEHPLSSEAQTGRAKITEIGAESLLTTAELRSFADALYNAGHYADALEQFRVLLRKPGLDPQTRNGFAVSEAACQLKLKRLTPAEVQALPDSADENGAQRLDLLMELARDRDDSAYVKQILGEMETRFPHSPWLADALYSAGNMHMLKHDYPAAIEYYGELAERFPGDKNAAAAHWRSGWLNYRLEQYPEAARIFDEQIRLYPGATESVSALYWRARLHETLDQNAALAAAEYRTIIRNYQHFFYAQMARRRLAALSVANANSLPGSPGSGSTQSDGNLQSADHPLTEPHLIDTSPEDSPHLAKARLLANAGLNEYIEFEIKADPEFASMSALAEAQIYSSYGETFRAVRAAKRGLPN